MTQKELVIKINKWEQEAGESFTDYFMHDRVKTLSWAFWLLGKGHKKTALTIIGGLEKGETYFDQETLFEIHPTYKGQKWIEGNHQKNIEIWAEFLVATKSYVERVTEFFNNKED